MEQVNISGEMMKSVVPTSNQCEIELIDISRRPAWIIR
jgi:hypothetical protein